MKNIFIVIIITALISGFAIAADISQGHVSGRPDGLTGASWQFGPLNRWAYNHIREILPTKDIPNDYLSVRPLPGLSKAKQDLTLHLDNKTIQLSKAMTAQYVDSLLVMKHGRIVLERYEQEARAERPHLMWSLSKSVIGLTAATVAADGLINLDKTVADYVPALAKSGWGKETLRSVLDMRTGAAWNEDYDAANSTVRRQDCADGLLTGPMCLDTKVIGNYKFMPTVGRDEENAGKFLYKSGDTDVMGWVLENATGQRLADLISERIWRPLGAERSAYITVDVSGFTLASGGMNATLRDIARLGQLMLDRGKVGDNQIVPAAWIDDIFQQAGDSSWSASAPAGTAPYYRSFWWGMGDGKGTIQAHGVHGQMIHVSPSTGVVIAIFSTWPNADGGAPGAGKQYTMELLAAITEALKD